MNKILQLRSSDVIIAEAINDLSFVSAIQLLARLLNLSILVDLVAVINPVAVDINSGREVMNLTAVCRGTDSALQVS